MTQNIIKNSGSELVFKTIYDGFGNQHQVFDDFSLPDYLSYDPKPNDVKDGFVASIINSKWVVQADHRNKVAYLKTDRSQFYIIDKLGDIPDTHTLIESDAAIIAK